MSPIGFVNKGLAPEFKSKHEALSQVSYHFRVLEKAGCIVLKKTVPRRGAAEHIFNGTGHLTTTSTVGRNRAKLYKNSALGLIARIAGAIDRGTFHSEVGSVVKWSVACLDPEGWSEIHESLERCSSEQKRIVEEAQQRSRKHGADELILGTLALLAFESPSHPGVIDCSCLVESE
ncbi:MAG: hypothetical protein ACTHK3_03340 [Solirubrobacterales bacterium]